MRDRWGRPKAAHDDVVRFLTSTKRRQPTPGSTPWRFARAWTRRPRR